MKIFTEQLRLCSPVIYQFCMRELIVWLSMKVNYIGLNPVLLCFGGLLMVDSTLRFGGCFRGGILFWYWNQIVRVMHMLFILLIDCWKLAFFCRDRTETLLLACLLAFDGGSILQLSLWCEYWIAYCPQLRAPFTCRILMNTAVQWWGVGMS